MGRTILAAAALWLPLASAGSGDGEWPCWRYDARRSASSPGALPEELHPLWSLKLPPVQPAWPNEPRLHFDASYEPVAAGGKLFLASPNDGSVAAFDAETGEERWRFFTEGPVRFAPAVWRGKVYAGSDDGHLYCLDAADGKVDWKFRGAPGERPDRRHLGNGRLISFWPVRGGPVVADGTVYFAAGIWPTMGVFVVAVDAGTGRLVWRNSGIGLIEKVRIDHNELLDTGMAPQGYLVVQEGNLIVPNGRSMPALLDRKTGKLIRYLQGYRNGDCRVAATGRYALVGEAGVVDLRTGREVGSRWAEAGKDAPDKFVLGKVDLFEAPFFPYKMFPGCSARSALEGEIAYGSQQGVFYAYDLSGATVSEYDKEQEGRKMRPRRWDAPALWSLQTPYAAQKAPSLALIKAGNRIYGHAGRYLLAIEISAAGGRPKVAWEKLIEGNPSGMIAAGGRLFVVTREGGIHCFSGRKAEPRRHNLADGPLLKPGERGTRVADEVLKGAAFCGGYGLVLGPGSGDLLGALLERTKLRLIVVDADRERVDALRRQLSRTGLYGTRVEALVGKPFEFPFPPYLAGLVVSEDPFPAGFSTGLPAKGLFEALRPYGGVACLAMPADRQEAFEKWAAAAKLENAEVSRSGGFALLRRAGPLPGSACWTHECADAARSYFSKDDCVRAPLGVLWYGDGPDQGMWQNNDYGTGVKPQVVGGRVFALQVRTATLHAYDVYTGRLHWTRKVDPFTRFASMLDGIYVAGGGACAVLDPATGEPLKTFKVEAGGEGGKPLFVSDIRVGEDVILVAAALEKVRVIEKGLWDSTVLVALDRRDGRMLWTREAKGRFNNHAIAIGRRTVFCVDSVASVKKEGGEAPATLPSTILALDARSGEVRWSAVTTNPHKTYGMGGWTAMRSNDDWLAFCEERGLLIAGKSGLAHAYDAATGGEVWQGRIGAQPLILAGGTFVTQGGEVFDAATGKPTGRKGLFTRGGGCNYAVGGRHLLFVRDHSASYVDLATGKQHYLRCVRSGCSNSYVAADGVLSVPNFAMGCVCNYPFQACFALVTMPETEAWGE